MNIFHKILLALFLILPLLSFTNDDVTNLNSLECFIGVVTAVPSDCNPNGVFSVDIDFEYEDTSEEFIVVGNGVTYGTYLYADLPITINGLVADCMTNFEFIVHDVDNNDCSADTGIGEVCCEGDMCMISSIDFTSNPACEDGQIITEWFIFGENTSESGYDISINGEFLLFVEYDGVGPYDFDIPSPETEYFTITACDNDNPDCCYVWELENPCYEGEGECFIGAITAVASDCNPNGVFSVDIDFEYEDTNEEFIVVGNGVTYGTYLYADLPITINGLVADCMTNFEFIVHDVDNNDCSADTGIGEVCCEGDMCMISSIDFTSNPTCEDGQIITEWFIFGENTSESGYDISINGEFLLFVEYDGLGPYDFDIPSPETEYFTITACDNDNPDCCYVWELENPCYEEEGECFIGAITAVPSDCNPNGVFSVDIDFEYEDTSEEFIVVGNGVTYGTYLYADLPIMINGLVADCMTNFEFIVHDVDNNDCSADTGIGEVCCEGDMCMISSIDFTSNPACEDGQIITEWFIYGENTSESGYDISINGEFLLFVEYDGLGPYDFDIPSPETEYFTITACDNDNPDCCYSWELENPCYEGEGECMINNVNAEIIACEENMFDVSINFEYENTSNEFIINGNGNNYGTFLYAELPIILTGLEADCSTVFEFVIHDVAQNDCSSDIEYGTVCCENYNEIEEIIVTNVINEELISINVNIVISLLQGCTVEVEVDGEPYSIINSDTFDFELGPFECGTDQVISIVLINICNGEETTFEIDLNDIDCTTGISEPSITQLLHWDQMSKNLTLTVPLDEVYELQVLDISGQLIVQDRQFGSSSNISFDHISTGIYFIRIENQNNEVGLKKVFVP